MAETQEHLPAFPQIRRTVRTHALSVDRRDTVRRAITENLPEWQEDNDNRIVRELTGSRLS